MPGNELTVSRFLVDNLGYIELPHLGRVATLGAPNPSDPGYTYITSIEHLNLISPGDSRKKADIYINNRGISIKQLGGSFSYNRLQRTNIPKLFSRLNFSNIGEMIRQMDLVVTRFHQGLIRGRDRPWQDFFSEDDFFVLAETLMMKYSANLGLSEHPASFILEAPAENISVANISVFTFNEYFEEYKDKFKIMIRRQWIGQASSEHTRALGLSQIPGNAPWVFDDVSGSPRGNRWREDYPPGTRKTVYFLMLGKIA